MVDFPLAIVTGGAHRLGRAFVTALAEKGYAVLVHYHTSEEQAFDTVGLAQRLQVPAFSYQADLREPQQVSELFTHVDKLIESPDTGVSRLMVLVNSAGRFSSTRVMSMPVEEWDVMLDLNLRAPFLCAQQAARRMDAGGLIVNITDVGAHKTWSRFPIYTVSKAGLETLTRVMARALAPTIRVNAIAPGLVLHSNLISQDEWKKLNERLPLRRSATTEEVASALGYLIENEYITGQTIVVDGGYTLI